VPSASNVAKKLLTIAFENDDRSITNLKLQKLLYYAQAWYLVNHQEKLFPDKIEAWDFGPVVPCVYGEFKKYTNKPIEFVPSGRAGGPFTAQQAKYLYDFYKVFGDLSSTALVSMSHCEKPWLEASEKPDRVISPKTMQDFYTKVYNKKHGKKAQRGRKTQ